MSFRHGTASGYRKHGCRCTACTGAATAACAAWKARHPEPLRHDNSTYVNYGCRCETCKAAHAAEDRQWYGRAS